MSPANQYKRFENRIALDLIRVFHIVAKAVSGFFKKFFQTGKQRFTIMLIPHSEKKIFNFKMSLFSLIFISVLLLGIVGSFLIFTTRFTGVAKTLSTKTEALEGTEASLEVIRDGLADLKKTAARFLDELSATRSSLRISSADQNTLSDQDGDLRSFFELQEQDEGLIRELGELKNLSESMLSSIDTLKDIKSIQESTQKLLADLPTMWPVAGRIRITNFFGFAEHPITGLTYLHKGIDVAKTPGADVRSAANGKVIERKFDKGGFGNYVLIRHKAGFMTKYAHMERVFVKEGDIVAQGQKIGSVGNTGVSTGYHLHFEVRLGAEVRDPLIYLRMKDSILTGSDVR